MMAEMFGDMPGINLIDFSAISGGLPGSDPTAGNAQQRKEKKRQAEKEQRRRARE